MQGRVGWRFIASTRAAPVINASLRPLTLAAAFLQSNMADVQRVDQFSGKDLNQFSGRDLNQLVLQSVTAGFGPR